MKKIIIIGSGGAGKSTLAQKLSEKLKLPVYYLDSYFWLPGWIKRDNTEFISINNKLLNEYEWIIEGNYQNTMELRMQACDTIIFLDYNRPTCYWGVAKRYFRDKGKSRPSMTDGCDEKFDREYYKLIWNYPKNKNKIFELIEKYKSGRSIYIFKNRKETDKFIGYEAGAS